MIALLKIEAVKQVAEMGKSASEVARNLDIYVNTLYQWIRFFKEDLEESFPGCGNLKSKDDEIRQFREETC